MGKFILNTQTEGISLNSAFHSLNRNKIDLNTNMINQPHSFKIEDILGSKNNNSTSSSASSISSLSSHYSPISVDNLIKKNEFFSPLLASNPFFPAYQTQSQTIPNYQDFLKSAQYFNNQNNQENSSSNALMKSNDINTTSDKLKLVNKFAKQIDALNENTNRKETSQKISKKNKLKVKKSHKTSKLDSCDSCSGNCADLACSISSVLPIDQAQLPMCLRGTTEDQLHLASLFNTLMHHKKCRRTRTVFTDMQLIGLEKRFENQKYLSTPDRIQLADSLGLSQLQVKTWYQNRRMKWKKKVLKDGCQEAPTKPKGRPKKNSIPSFSEIIKAAAEADRNNGTSNNESCDSRSNLSLEDEDDDDDNESMVNDGYTSESDMDEIDVEDDSDNDDQNESLNGHSSTQSDCYLK